MSVDQTYHTPSFGDEEFDIPPLAYAPAAAATRCSGQGVYSNQVPVEYLKRKLNSDPFCVYLPRQDSFNDCSLYNQQSLSHFRPPESLVHSSYHHSSNMNNDQAFHHQQQQNRQDCYQNNMLHSMSMQMSYDDRGPYAENHMQPPQMTVLHQQNHMMGPPQQTPMFSTINQSQLGLQMGHPPPNSQGGSPPGSNHNSPGLETSEDSDDSTPLAQLMSTMKQRPSPEPTEVSVRAPKKPKAQKKKKKRDPNEPQK
ncbi:TOX high mobility group box family member 3-like [Uloborus diversus]|uniref:TOX high mobility group box family member 3-like n=1 Tax=Uloborus diversus TaxID=327109 RepID=UPI002409CDB3|nr:TOX high mobility group box family member 3-like [Uloborus diversus]